jgi:hypothetical protein
VPSSTCTPYTASATTHTIDAASITSTDADRRPGTIDIRMARPMKSTSPAGYSTDTMRCRIESVSSWA